MPARGTPPSVPGASRTLIARTVLALRGQLPWRLLGFLEDAHRRGLLRRRSVYEFRHARLQEALRGIEVPEPRPGR